MCDVFRKRQPVFLSALSLEHKHSMRTRPRKAPSLKYLDTAQFQHITEKVVEFLLLCLYHKRDRERERERERGGKERGSIVLGVRGALQFLTMAVDIRRPCTRTHVHLTLSLSKLRKNAHFLKLNWLPGDLRAMPLPWR